MKKSQEQKSVSILDRILEEHPDYEFLKADGFDDCIIGYDYGSGDPIRLIYSVTKILDKLYEEFKEDGLDEMDAIEYFEYNMRGGYVGEKTPIWCQDDL
jgi:hypothetical protein